MGGGLYCMRQAVLGREFEDLPVDLYFTQKSLVDHRFSTRLNITPFGEDAVFLGGRLSVCIEGRHAANISLRRLVGSKLLKDRGDRLPVQLELPARCDPSSRAITVTGYVLYSGLQTGIHYRCALAPDGSIRPERVTAFKVRLLQWLAAWRDFLASPLD